MSSSLVCYQPDNIVTNGIWDANDLSQLTDYTLPVLIYQVCSIVILSQLFAAATKRLFIPKFVAEIAVGFFLGPSGIGQLQDFMIFRLLFPRISHININAVGFLGMFYYLFIVGIHCNIRIMANMGMKVFAIGVASLLLPFSIGLVAAMLSGVRGPAGVPAFTYHFHLVVIPCLTAFPVLSRLITELKLVNTEIGRLALYSAVVSDLFAWVLFSVAEFLPVDEAVLRSGMQKPVRMAALWLLVSGVMVILFAWVAFRPFMSKLEQQAQDDQEVSNVSLGLVLIGALGFGFLMDAVGFPAVFGAFIVGLMMPKGMMADVLVNRLELMVVSVLLPVFFAIIGSNVSLASASSFHTPVVGLFVLVTVVKVVGTMLAARLFSIPLMQGFCLGLLLCAKGQIEMIILEIARRRMVIALDMFVVLVISSVVVTTVTAVLVSIFGKRVRGQIVYKRRNLAMTRPESELRLLACVHTWSNVPGILSLLQMSRPTKRSPVFLCVLQLLELTSRVSTFLAVHDNAAASSSHVSAAGQPDMIAGAFKSLQQYTTGLATRLMTAVSPYSSMHYDICSAAEEHHTTLIILPFGQNIARTGVDDHRASLSAVRDVNQRVLSRATCSVGILVDRGIGAVAESSLASAELQQVSHHVAVLFFGGPDDREAVACGARLAANPAITLYLIRFVMEGERVITYSDSISGSTTRAAESAMAMPAVDIQREMDDRCVYDFRLKHSGEDRIIYVEIGVHSSDETVHAIRDMREHYDMYVVGRGHRRHTPMLEGMSEWMQYPELGLVGDFLVSPDLGSTASVLSIQQYVKVSKKERRWQ